MVSVLAGALGRLLVSGTWCGLALLGGPGLGITPQPRAVAPTLAHPIHTTLTELSVEPDGGGVRVVVRAFADDFGAVVGKFTGIEPGTDHTVPDAAVARYVAARIELTDRVGRRVALNLSGTRRAGDLVWVTLRGPSIRSLAGLRIANRMLFERFDDQVNIVQAVAPAGRKTILLTKRDPTPQAVMEAP